MGSKNELDKYPSKDPNEIEKLLLELEATHDNFDSNIFCVNKTQMKFYVTVKGEGACDITQDEICFELNNRLIEIGVRGGDEQTLLPMGPDDDVEDPDTDGRITKGKRSMIANVWIGTFKDELLKDFKGIINNGLAKPIKCKEVEISFAPVNGVVGEMHLFLLEVPERHSHCHKRYIRLFFNFVEGTVSGSKICLNNYQGRPGFKYWLLYVSYPGDRHPPRTLTEIIKHGAIEEKYNVDIRGVKLIPLTSYD